jgi:hypothetical protein
MPYFLIAQDADGSVSLLSPVAWPTRSEALGELSRMTGRADFSYWESEVSVVDLDSAVPVLLVRPAGATEPSSARVAEPLEAAEAEVAGAIAEAVESGAELHQEETEPACETDASEYSAVAFEAPEEPGVTPIEAQLASRGEPVEQAEAFEEVEVIGRVEAIEATQVAEESEGSDADDDLRAALQRTAEQMEEAGLTPPPSAGLLGDEDARASWAVSGATDEVATMEEPDRDEAGNPPIGHFELETVPAETPASAEEPAAPVSVAPTWPWGRTASAASSSAAAAPDLVEEESPASDEVAQAPVSEVVAAVAAEPGDEAQPQAPDVGEPPTPAETSDFILDLDAVSAAVAGSESPSPLAGYTCEECVYVETCPNKGQKSPAECVSFQWK